MKQFYTLFLCLFTAFAFSQVPTELTSFLNLPCDFTVCEDIQLGVCPGDTYSDGTEVQFPEFQIYYVTENVVIEYNSLTLRNSRLEFRNGSNFVDNGIVVDIQNDCDDTTTTEIVFIGGGNRFASVEAMNQTLGIEPLDVFKKKANKTYYTIEGKELKNIETSAKGIYIIKYHLDGRVETEKHIKY